MNDWITRLEDVTGQMHHLRDLAQTSRGEAKVQLPVERPYVLSPDLAAHTAATPTT